MLALKGICAGMPVIALLSREPVHPVVFAQRHCRPISEVALADGVFTVLFVIRYAVM